MKKKIFSVLTICMLVASLPFISFAHSGNTDANGGHRDNKNRSGLGGYHYHCGGHPPHLHAGGVCPYKGGSSSGSSTSVKKTSAPKPVYASSISAQNVPVQLNIGDTVTLEASVYPSNAEDKDISWESSDNTVLTVNKTGALTAVGIGAATITAKTSRGTSKSFAVTVNEIMAESISIENNEKEIMIGNSAELICKFTPDNTTNKDVTWKSENESIVTVTADGNITGKDIGQTVITATHKELTDSITIKVNPIEADKVEIILPKNIKMKDDVKPIIKKGSSIQLSSSIEPENTTYKDVEWSVSNKEFASIDEHGVLTALSNGVVTVTAITKCGKSDDIELEIYSNTGLGFLGIGGTIVVIGAGLVVWIKKKENNSDNTV